MHDEPPRDRVRETRAPDPEHPPPPHQPRRYETRAPRLSGREPRGSAAVLQGVTAAIGLAVAMVFVGTFGFLGLLGYSEGAVSGTTFGVALLIVLLAAVGGAMVVARGLPRPARGSFWAMSVVCLASVLLMMFGVCGVGSVIRG